MNRFSKKRAFTLAEIMIVFSIIAIVATATLGIVKSQINYAKKSQYYATYMNLKKLSSELIGAGYTLSGAPNVIIKSLPPKGNYDPADATYPLGLCQRATNIMNTIGTVDCSKTTTSGFTSSNANFTVTNGMKLYNFGSDPASGAYIVYVDMNGTSGSSVLNIDVMPFIMNINGTVFPRDDGATSPARDTNFLSASVKYWDATNKIYQIIENGVSYYQAACDVSSDSTYNGTSCTRSTAATAASCGSTNTCELTINKPGY